MAELQPTQKEVDLFEEKYGTTKSKLSFRLALRFHIPMWIWVVVLLFCNCNAKYICTDCAELWIVNFIKYIFNSIIR